MFDSKVEMDTFLATHKNIDPRHHGFLGSYFNKTYAQTSPAHARSYTRIAEHITADLRRLMPLCQTELWTIELNETEDVYAADPRGIRDAWACKMEAYRRNYPQALDWSPLECKFGFGFMVTPTRDNSGKPRQINWGGECTKEDNELHCGVQLFIGSQTQGYGQTYERVIRNTACEKNEYTVVNAHTGEETCYSWTAMFARMRP